MKFYYDDNRGTDQFTLQDFEPSFGAKMGAAVDEAWLESYGPTPKRRTFGSELLGIWVHLCAARQCLELVLPTR